MLMGASILAHILEQKSSMRTSFGDAQMPLSPVRLCLLSLVPPVRGDNLAPDWLNPWGTT